MAFNRLGVVAVVLAVVLSAGTAVAFTATGPAQTAPTAGADALADNGEPAQHNLQPGQAQTGEPTQTDNQSAAEVVQNARQSYGGIQNFNATLVSTTNTSNGTGSTDSVETRANISFEKPNNFRYEFLAPANQSGNVIISNGTSTLFYNEANNTYRTFSFNESTFGGMGATNLSETGYLDSINRTLTQSNVSYEGTATVADRETYVLSVEPTGIAANVTDNATYYLDQDTYLPVKTTTQASFSFGNETTSFESTTLLRDVRTNVDMPATVFDFTPPEGAERLESPLSNVSMSSYTSVEQARQNTDIRICEPSEIPGNYSFANATESSVGNNTSVTLRYTNGSDDPTAALSVTISDATTGQQSTGSGIGENVSIDGQSGTYVEAAGQGVLSFTSDDAQYTITGPFSQDELVSIAESIDCVAGGDDAADGADEPAADDTDAANSDTDTADDGDAAYYQVDFVAGDPIENFETEGTYANDRLLRFAHGSTDEPVMRRAPGMLAYGDAPELNERIESQEITIENDTAEITFTVDDGESVQLSLVSYEKVGPGWSPATEDKQEFIDADTRTFKSGTHTLTVDLPDKDSNSTAKD
ncbi:DUF4367 domain-containing protein [Halococcus thailandensis]|uniref:DUF4367 domain-containing protein n=1 Tax=Halococcus thailandensis TaxID=335952 RepID=UPI0009B5A3E1|nr:DUF4367 domain-containing protein [Halococcus thailandensis]